MVEQLTDSFSRIAGYYDERVHRYGHDPRACDYGRPESQLAKFKVLSEVSPIHGCSLLDIGCGFADFASYLRDRFPGVQYSGIDLSSAMIAEARRLHSDLELKVGNFLDHRFPSKFDIVTANGIFYLLGEHAWPSMKLMIDGMFALANLAVSFNSLSAWAIDKEESEFYADPLETLAYCRTLTPSVVLRHDYHPRDFTIYLYKGGRQ